MCFLQNSKNYLDQKLDQENPMTKQMQCNAKKLLCRTTWPEGTTSSLGIVFNTSFTQNIPYLNQAPATKWVF